MSDSMLTELHVFVVPNELWLEKYRVAYNNVLVQSTSAGFIRVSSKSTLSEIRQSIVDQLGNAVVPERYVYLRSIGRCMAMVNENQETVLLANDFLPPQTASPEVFLLPGTRDENSQGTSRELILSNTSSEYTSPVENIDFSTLIFPLNVERSSNNVSTLTNHSSKLGNVYKAVKSGNDQSQECTHGSTFSEDYCANCSEKISASESQNDKVVEKSSILQPNIAFIPATPVKDASNVFFITPSPIVNGERDISDNELTDTLTRQERRALKIHQKKSSLKNIHKKLVQENLRKSLLHEDQSPQDNEKSSDKGLQTDSYTELGGSTDSGSSFKKTDEELRKAEIEAKIKARYEQEMMNLDMSSSQDQSPSGSPKKTPSKEPETYSGSEHEPIQMNKVDHSPRQSSLQGFSQHSSPKHNLNDGVTNHNQSSVGDIDHAESFNDKVKQNEDNDEENHDSIDQAFSSTQSFDDNHESPEHLQVNRSEEKLRQGASSRPTTIDINEEELMLKIKEIEEIKKQKKENKKKKQIEKEEKHQNELEIIQKKKNRIEELKREIEKVKEDKHDFVKAREASIKKQRHLQAELNAKQNHVNNAWRKKYMEERKKTTVLEDEIRKLNKDIETQHRKLVNSSTRGQSGNFPVGVRGNGNPSERTNQRNMVLKLQNENEDLKLRIELAAKKLAAETKMKAFVQQELKDLRSKAIKSKINVAKYNKK